MFDKLDDILMRLEEVLNQLSEPDVAADAAKFQKLMKEQAELQPIADAYKDYKTQKQTIEESLMLLEEESDEEMREMLKEELSDAKKRVEELEQELAHPLRLLHRPVHPPMAVHPVEQEVADEQVRLLHRGGEGDHRLRRVADLRRRAELLDRRGGDRTRRPAARERGRPPSLLPAPRHRGLRGPDRGRHLLPRGPPVQLERSDDALVQLPDSSDIRHTGSVLCGYPSCQARRCRFSSPS